MKTIVDKMPTSAKDCDFAREREDCKKHKYFGCSKGQIVCQLGEKEGWSCPFYTDASAIKVEAIKEFTKELENEFSNIEEFYFDEEQENFVSSNKVVSLINQLFKKYVDIERK